MGLGWSEGLQARGHLPADRRSCKRKVESLSWGLWREKACRHFDFEFLAFLLESDFVLF